MCIYIYIYMSPPGAGVCGGTPPAAVLRPIGFFLHLLVYGQFSY